MKKKTFSAYNFLTALILCLLTVLFIFPFYWIMTGAFKSQPDTIIIPPQWWPKAPTLENFKALTVQNPALRWLWNSVFISIMTMFLVCCTSSMAGYVLAKKRFYGQKILFSLFIAAMALPKQVVLVPLVRIINFMGIHDTLWAVILPLVGWPFGVFLMKQFSENIPTELLESAKIDGCGEIRTFINVAFPIVKPGFAALAIFTFINTWNDYFMQLVMLTSRNNLTISLGVATMQAEMATNYGLIMAGAALAEAVSGSAKDSSIALCLTIGTGIGGCLIIDKTVFHGFSNSACEVGYMHLSDGDFQDLASTTALIADVAKAHGDEISRWDGRRIFQEAKKGNEKCIASIDRMINYLGQGIANMVYVVNPEKVVLGGGIMAQKDYLQDKLSESLKRNLVTSLAEKTAIVFAQHENQAGMLGAYYHFKNRG